MTKSTSVTEQRSPHANANSTALAESGRPPGILVVDDEIAILVLLERVLRHQGFHVWTASSGEAALHLFERHQDEVDLALLDVRLPGMDGPNILAALLRLRPSIQAYFMTGDSGIYPTEELLARGAIEVFHKPFDLHEVVQHLWSICTVA